MEGTPKPEEMALPPAADYTDYYVGTLNNAKLVARSSTLPWVAPIKHDGTWSGAAAKLVFAVEHRHPLRETLNKGLRDNILRVLSTMRPCVWVSIHYVRLGYDDGGGDNDDGYNDNAEENNPVVALITVRENLVSSAEGQRIVDAVHEECKNAGVPDVEAEIMEGEPATTYCTKPLLLPKEYPFMGASTAISSRDVNEHIPGETGTLGGYVKVGDKVVGLTNHHVVFGNSRTDAFPTEDEAAARVSYTMLQPSELDLEDRIDTIKAIRQDYAKEQTEKGDPSLNIDKITVLDKELAEFQHWTHDTSSALGPVWRSSGLRVRTGQGLKCRMDWALIDLANSKRFSAPEKFVNEVPRYSRTSHTMSRPYFKLGLKLDGGAKLPYDMPLYMRRTITFKEINSKEGRRHVVWKSGRTSHITFGLLSEIESNHRNENGLITDEQVVIDCRKSKVEFSCDGDSGSLVFDSDGAVCALLWGGTPWSPFTYVTPIEYVLEDIQAVCKAEATLVVGTEAGMSSGV